MLKSQEISSAPPSGNFPTAPPSYDEAIMKPPAHNPNAPYPQITTAYPVQAAPAAGSYPPAAVPYTSGPPMVSVVSVGPSPVTMVCPHCQKRMRTSITTSAQKTAHIAALVLCLFGCWFCCCIPYCLSSFQDVHHRCSECKAYIATYKH